MGAILAETYTMVVTINGRIKHVKTATCLQTLQRIMEEEVRYNALMHKSIFHMDEKSAAVSFNGNQMGWFIQEASPVSTLTTDKDFEFSSDQRNILRRMSHIERCNWLVVLDENGNAKRHTCATNTDGGHWIGDLILLRKDNPLNQIRLDLYPDERFMVLDKYLATHPL